MFVLNQRVALILSLFALPLFCAAAGAQSTGTLRGQVTDESGAIIPSATVTIIGPAGQRSVTTDNLGNYTVAGLAPGAYTVEMKAAGMGIYRKQAVSVSAGAPLVLNAQLHVGEQKEQVTVAAEGTPAVNTDPSANAGALVLKGADLDALPDDPDDLEADLQALAGPAAGPNGGQIFIDGFSNGRLPPKESIREIRINQNPFSAEYDRIGFGRIEILTKPGTDKFRGQAFFNFSDNVFNARNPFADNKGLFESRQYGGNLSGPINNRASFFFDVDRREIDDDAVIHATILDPSLNIATLGLAVQTPNRRTTFSPRIDYQLSKNHTLTFRYSFTRFDQVGGIGNFSLQNQQTKTLSNENLVQATETAVLSSRMVNETRFQFMRDTSSMNPATPGAEINVLGSFIGGGVPTSGTANTDSRYELQNYTTITLGPHTVRFGGRLRVEDVNNSSPGNFAGTFTFSGGLAPVLDANNQPTGEVVQISSIEAYRRTLLFEGLGYTPQQIRTLGGEPSRFTIAAGDPLAAVDQVDVGVFFQDDWRAKPNLTLSLGLRYETQNNIHDWRDFAPRIGIAWAPGARAGQRQPKTVFRGGLGVFYDRFSDNYTLNALRYNGVTQQQFVVLNPTFFPSVPPISQLQAQQVPQAIQVIGSDLRAPYLAQGAAGVERQVSSNATMALTYTYSRGVHMLRSRDINAPLPSGLRPYGDVGPINAYESTGILNQNQIIYNLNLRIGSKISLSGNYVYNHAMSDTDGAGTFPSDQYDLHTEYSRAAYDIRNRVFFGGSMLMRYGWRISPFFVASSGRPFNITLGTDPTGDSIFTARPALASNLALPTVVQTPWGNFDTAPIAGEEIIARNFGESPGQVSLNLRLSKTFGFGPSREARYNPSGGGPRGGGPHGGGGPRGGGRGMMMGGGGMRGLFGDSSTDHRFNLIFSIEARNALNHLNPGPLTGNLTSPNFGQATSLAGFGPGGNAANRRLTMNLRFSF